MSVKNDTPRASAAAAIELPAAQELNATFALDIEARRALAERLMASLQGSKLSFAIYEDRAADGSVPVSLLIAGEKPSKTSAARATWSFSLGDSDGSVAPWRSVLRLIITGDLDPESADALDRLQVACAALLPTDESPIHSQGPATFEFKMGMVVAGPAMQRVIRLIELYAPEKSCVLITGESGTGKERIAQALHAASNRKGKKVTINCGCIPPELIATELFGHERGAFSGAHNSKLGAFEAADGGTLFLDEIGEMPTDQQVALLRVLQEGAIRRVGSNAEKKIDVRVVAATNSDLQDLVAQGRFRRDLYYRLCGLTIELPALRDRADEIPALVEHHITKMNAEHAREISITPDAVRSMQTYSWPGNVRELVQTLDRCRVHAIDGIIDLDTFEIALAPSGSPAATTQPRYDAFASSSNEPAVAVFPIKLDGTPLADQLLAFEAELLTTALRATSFNHQLAAGLVHTSEPVLRQRIVALGIGTDGATYSPIISNNVSQLRTRGPIAA